MNINLNTALKSVSSNVSSSHLTRSTLLASAAGRVDAGIIFKTIVVTRKSSLPILSSLRLLSLLLNYTSTIPRAVILDIMAYTFLILTSSTIWCLIYIISLSIISTFLGGTKTKSSCSGSSIFSYSYTSGS